MAAQMAVGNRSGTAPVSVPVVFAERDGSMDVKVSTVSPYWDHTWQFPGRSGRWGDVRFFIDDDCAVCDAWVVYEDLAEIQTVLCPPDRILLVTGEPPSVRSYPEEFLRQFSRIVTCHEHLPHRAVVLTQQGLPWHIGRVAGEVDSFCEGYDSLMAASPRKERLISIISSDKQSTEGHRRRWRFVQAFMKKFGDVADVFGRGFAPVACKRDALFPYKYHIAIENSRTPHYWTEKLADAYLAETFPIYDGCPNIGDYFPSESFCSIDVEDIPGSCAAIERLLAEDPYEKRREVVRHCKELVLNKYNLFPTLVEHLHPWSGPETVESRPVTLRPQREFKIKGRALRVLRSLFAR